MWRKIGAILLTLAAATVRADDKKTAGPATTEVDGVVISAQALRDAKLGGSNISMGPKILIEVRAKDRVKPISAWFSSAPTLLDAQGKPFLPPENDRSGGVQVRDRPPQNRGAPDADTRGLTFEFAPFSFGRRGKGFPDSAKVIPKMKGEISVANSGWRSFDFSGTAFKPNAVAKVNGVEAKLAIVDVEDGLADLGVRFEDPSGGRVARTGEATPAAMTVKFDNGKSQPLAQRSTSSYGGADGKHFTMLRFRGAVPPNAKIVSAVLSAESNSFDGVRQVRFELVDVPIGDK